MLDLHQTKEFIETLYQRRKQKTLHYTEELALEQKRDEVQVALNIKDTQKRIPRIEEELALEDRALYDSDFQPFIDITRPNGQKEGKN